MKKRILLFLLVTVASFSWHSANAVPTITSNLSAYQFDTPEGGSWNLSNITDGNYSTLFWSNTEQATGDYIQLDYGEASPVCSIKFYFTRNSGGSLWDAPNGTVKIQRSNDASEWSDVATFTAAEIGGAETNNVYICDAGGELVRYIRLLVVNATSSAWMRISEVETETNCVKTPRTVTVESANAAMGDAYIGTPDIKTVTKGG
ncbi:MAG: discoidin domain-containing protein, partial [Bacteroidales bacterium]